MRFAFIDAEKASFPVTALCKALEVSRSGYYAWRDRPPSARALEDAALTKEIVQAHRASRGVYGSPRVHQELRAKGFSVARKRVARLMAGAGLRGCQPRPFRRTTDSDHPLPVAPNRLQRDFTAAGPDRKWATDITYVRTWQGWLYLAVVLDLYSRRVVGWSTASHMRTELVLDALQRALGRRVPGAELVHHSDRGSQYASKAYQAVLDQHGIVCSMSGVGDCYDNAVVESFFGTLKNELVHRRAWPTRQDAHAAIADYIELFYNPRRRHSSLGYVSPMAYERNYLEQRLSAA